MIEALFIATERFDATDGDKWTSYCQWAKIPGLREIVSLDGILCPPLISEFIDEDWAHIVNENFRLNYFLDLPYLLRRVASIPRRNVLGLYRNPEENYSRPPAVGDFAFMGYDLIEDMTMISALVNCGGFPETFSNQELNNCGLLGEFNRARTVQRLLKEKNPEEPHANCELYAIWRLRER